MSRPTASLFLFTIASAVMLAACQPAKSEPAAATSTNNTTTTTVSTAPAAPSVDGQKEVSLVTTYTSPAGKEEVGFTLVIDNNGVITDAKTQVMATAPASVQRQKSFAAELPTVVKGKKLSEITKVDRVGGSSLTTGAFNAALSQLKAQL